MTGVYVSLEEASLFEGISYKGFTSRVSRNSGEFQLKKEGSINGGKEKILINLDSLSSKARKAYKAMLKIEDNEVNNDEDSSTWYIDTDLSWYIENYKKYYYKSVELSKTIEEYLEESKNTIDKSILTKKYAQKVEMSERSFYRKVKDYLVGIAWSNKMHQFESKNYDFYKILALCRKPSEKNKFISLTDEMKVYIENMWFDPKFSRNQGHMVRIREMMINKSVETLWEVPSYPTITRFIDHLDKVHGNERQLLVKGDKKYKGDHMIKARRDTRKLQVMEVVMGDGHTFDCWVSIKRENGKMDAVRPHILAWIDLRSRSVVSHSICDVPDSSIMAKTIVNMIYPKKDLSIPFEGCPKYLYIDNGKEYTAEFLTGRKRSVRWEFNQDTKGFYKSIGIEDDIRALPYHSWSKAQVERFFGTVCKMFTKGFDSYTGTLTGSKTIGKVNKDVPKMLKNGELLSIQEFAKLFDNWLTEVYHKRQHGGLKRQKESVATPIEVYKNAERYYKAAPPMEYAEFLLMKTDVAHVYNTGIEKFGFSYMAQELGILTGSKVMVRHNPDDISKIYVYTVEGKKICEAVSYELLEIGSKNNSEALINHLKNQRNQMKQVKEDLKYLQMPFDERIALKEKTSIMADLKEGNPKVVSLPQANVKDEIKEAKLKKNQKKSIENDYFSKKGEEVINQILNMA